MTDTHELISRLEVATEGSRELDEAIATAIWGEPKPSGNVGGVRILVWQHNGLERSIAPEFTESLDAAMTLVPEGESWDCGWEAANPHGMAWVGSNNPQVIASTPTLALCIAALTARAACPTPRRSAGGGAFQLFRPRDRHP